METLSARARLCLERKSELLLKTDNLEDKYDPHTNPKGVVSMASADNRLCEDILIKRIKEFQKEPEHVSNLYYTKYTGVNSLKLSVKRFLERHFRPAKPLDVNNILMTRCVTNFLEYIAFAVADQGDYIMVPSPFYYRIRGDMYERAFANILEVPLDASNRSVGDILEDVYTSAKMKGQSVKGLIFVNPNNPTGQMYSKTQIKEVIEFAKRNKIHVFFNELYALSVFEPDVEFCSSLTLNKDQSEFVHLIYGFSKDFGLSGYGGGVLYSTNQQLLRYIGYVSVFSWLFPLQSSRLEALLNDTDWTDTVFIPAFRERLRLRQNHVRAMLSDLGVLVCPASATIFVWTDLSQFLPQPTYAAENWLCDVLIKHGVFLAPGKEFAAHSPGWFRLLCALDEVQHNEGMSRLKSALESLKKKKTLPLSAYDPELDSSRLLK